MGEGGWGSERWAKDCHNAIQFIVVVVVAAAVAVVVQSRSVQNFKSYFARICALAVRYHFQCYSESLKVRAPLCFCGIKNKSHGIIVQMEIQLPLNELAVDTKNSRKKASSDRKPADSLLLL